MSFDWNHARTFLSVAEEGSLSAAARKLGQTQPTVSRQIAGLEEALGVTLFERTGRSVQLTEAGVGLLDHVRTMESGANLVALAASGRAQSVEGLVRITAAEAMAAYVLPPVLRTLLDSTPMLEIDVVADNGVRDLVRREADIAVRHARPEQSGLIARRVADEVMRFYASPAYVERHGVPDAGTLSDHQIISFIETDRMLGYLQPIGPDLTKKNFRLSSTSQCVAWEMARSGLGILVYSDRIAGGEAGLVPVLTDIGPFAVPTWLVAHRELQTSRRVRLVFDHLAEALS